MYNFEQKPSIGIHITDYHNAAMVVRNVAPGKWQIFEFTGEDICGMGVYKKQLNDQLYDRVVVSKTYIPRGQIGLAYLFVQKNNKWGLIAISDRGDASLKYDTHVFFKAVMPSIASILRFFPLDLGETELYDTAESINDELGAIEAELHPQNQDFAEMEPLRYLRRWYTPAHISHLHANQIFVFGSNKEGMHGGGAARYAMDHFGAVWGEGVGRTGQCYAIPTMHGGVEAIRPYVDDFIDYAAAHPELEFLVTPIGCGIAGYSEDSIAPLFREALRYGNIVLPEGFVRRM